MKKLLVMAAMVLSSVGAFAQYEAGDFTIQPKVGLNASNFSGDISDTDWKAGFVGGVEAEYHVSPLFGLSAGLLYSQQGTKYSRTIDVEDVKVAGDYKLKADYLNIPVLANFYVAKGLALKAGLQPGFLVNAKRKLTASAAGVSKDVETDVKDDFKSFDFSIPVGISYEYAGFCLDARYNIGVSNIADNTDAKVHNQVFQLTLGYKFKL